MEPMSHLAVDEQPSFDRGGRHDGVCTICEYLGDIYRIYINNIQQDRTNTFGEVALINIYRQSREVQVDTKVTYAGSFYTPQRSGRVPART